MPAINFKRQFARKVFNETKQQTIRADGKRIFKVGDTLHLFTGQRTPFCVKLGTAVVDELVPIVIYGEDKELFCKGILRGCCPQELWSADGFASEGDFFDFFRTNYGNKFIGKIIKWTNFQPNKNIRPLSDLVANPLAMTMWSNHEIAAAKDTTVKAYAWMPEFALQFKSRLDCATAYFSTLI